MAHLELGNSCDWGFTKDPDSFTGRFFFPIDLSNSWACRTMVSLVVFVVVKRDHRRTCSAFIQAETSFLMRCEKFLSLSVKKKTFHIFEWPQQEPDENLIPGSTSFPNKMWELPLLLLLPPFLLRIFFLVERLYLLKFSWPCPEYYYSEWWSSIMRLHSSLSRLICEHPSSGCSICCPIVDLLHQKIRHTWHRLGVYNGAFQTAQQNTKQTDTATFG